MSTDDFQALMYRSRSLGQLITERMLPQLPCLSNNVATPPAQSMLVLIHALLSAALMEIQRFFSTCGIATSGPGYIASAQRVLNLFEGASRQPHIQLQTPFAGIICSPALEALGKAADDLITNGQGNTQYGMTLQNSALSGMATMSTLALNCPLTSELHMPP